MVTLESQKRGRAEVEHQSSCRDLCLWPKDNRERGGEGRDGFAFQVIFKGFL